MEQKKKIGTLYTLLLENITKENEVTYTFSFVKPDNFTWEEGACIHLGNTNFDSVNGRGNKPHVRHLSILSLPEEGNLKITTRIPEDRSDFKENLSQAKVGDSFTLFKPENRLKLERADRPIILISAGVAIATTRSQMFAFSKSQKGIPSLHHINIDSSGEYLFKDEISDFVNKTKRLTNVFVSSRADFYEELESRFDQEAIYYIVGSDTFLIDVAKRLLAKGIPQPSIILDKKPEFYEELSTMATAS